MNRYEEPRDALVQLLDKIEQAQDQKNTTIEAFKGMAQGMNPASIMMNAPKLAPLVAQFAHDQAVMEGAIVEALHKVVEVVEKAADAEEELLQEAAG